MGTKKINQKLLQYYLDNYDVQNIVVDNESVREISSSNSTIWRSNSDFIYTLLEDGTYSIKAAKNISGFSLIIPSTFNSRQITKIDDYGFAGCWVREVTVPDSIKIIGDYAFNESDIMRLEMPSVELIGEGACKGCANLMQVVFNEDEPHLLSIGDHAFENCNYLETFNLPSTLAAIGSYAFSGTDLLSEITLPASLLELGDYAFANSGVRKAYIAANSKIARIGAHAFEYSSLGSISLPASVTDIGEYAFANCENCEVGIAATKITEIKEGTFYNCTNITATTIPNTVQTIADNAYYNCINLATIDFTNAWRVKTIGKSAFFNHNCETLILPNNVTSIGYKAFGNSSAYPSKLNFLYLPFVGNTLNDTSDTHLGYIFNGDNSNVPETLKSVDFAGSYVPDNAFRDCQYISKIYLYEDVTSIGNAAFGNCTSLTSITIPNSVTTIGIGAFAGSGLTSISFEYDIWSINGTVRNLRTTTDEVNWLKGTYAAYVWRKYTDLVAPVITATVASSSSIKITYTNNNPVALTPDGEVDYYYNSTSHWDNLLDRDMVAANGGTITISSYNVDIDGADAPFTTADITAYFAENPDAKATLAVDSYGTIGQRLLAPQITSMYQDTSTEYGFEVFNPNPTSVTCYISLYDYAASTSGTLISTKAVDVAANSMETGYLEVGSSSGTVTDYEMQFVASGYVNSHYVKGQVS